MILFQKHLANMLSTLDYLRSDQEAHWQLCQAIETMCLEYYGPQYKGKRTQDTKPSDAEMSIAMERFKLPGKGKEEWVSIYDGPKLAAHLLASRTGLSIDEASDIIYQCLNA